VAIAHRLLAKDELIGVQGAPMEVLTRSACKFKRRQLEKEQLIFMGEQPLAFSNLLRDLGGQVLGKS